MMMVPSGVRVHIALGVTDLRKGLDGLAMLVQEVLEQDPFSGHLFAEIVEKVVAAGVFRCRVIEGADIFVPPQFLLRQWIGTLVP